MQAIQRYIISRHNLTKLERLELRRLLKRAKIASFFKREINSMQKFRTSKNLETISSYDRWISIFEREKLLFEDGNITKSLLKLKNDSIAKVLLKEDNIALNEVFELKKERDSSIIEAFFKRYNKDTLNDKIFDKTFNIAKKLEVKVSFIAQVGDGACYTPCVKLISMLFNNKPKELKTNILLHELIHSVSIHALNNLEMIESNSFAGYRYPKLFTDSQFKPLKNIKELYKSLPQNIKEQKGDDCYGFINDSEFLAELANPRFREKLQKIGILKMLLKNYHTFLKAFE